MRAHVAIMIKKTAKSQMLLPMIFAPFFLPPLSINVKFRPLTPYVLIPPGHPPLPSLQPNSSPI